MTKRDLALHLLRQAGERGVTTAEFMQAGVGSRYGARLLELREIGHVIDAQRVRDGAWRYTLIHDAATVPLREAVPFMDDDSVRLFDPPSTPARSPYDLDAA